MSLSDILASKLDSVFPQYKKVSDADPNDLDPTKFYKAITSHGDVVYMLQNPALMTAQVGNGANPVMDIRRIRIGTLKECQLMIDPFGKEPLAGKHKGIERKDTF